KYDQLRAQNKISTDESACLQDEKNAVLGHEARLRDKLVEAMQRGTGLFRGFARDASSLGKGLGEILKKLYSHAVPDFYPKARARLPPAQGDRGRGLAQGGRPEGPAAAVLRRRAGARPRDEGRSEVRAQSRCPGRQGGTRLPRRRARLRQQGVPHRQG